MSEKKDIADLLEEVETLVDALRDEKSALRDQVISLEAQLSMVKEENTKDVQKLQDSHAQLTKEFQSTKARLSSDLEDTQQKLDRFHPELQSLKNELRNGELQNQILDIELFKKNKEIKDLEDRLSAYTSLPSSSSPVEESIV